MSTAPLLDVRQVVAGYGGVMVLHDISLHVNKGEIVSVLGANGAGKSTLLNVISGIVPSVAGTISYDSRPMSGLSAARISRAGLRQVPEGRRVFPDLSVRDNLRLGGFGRTAADAASAMLEVFALFPRLRERESQSAGTLSGGEQQMLAIGRAIVGRPRLLMLDEPSMGLAPLITIEILKLIVKLRESLGLSILLVEQNARAAMRISDRSYIIAGGKVEMEGASRDLVESPTFIRSFLRFHA